MLAVRTAAHTDGALSQSGAERGDTLLAFSSPASKLGSIQLSIITVL